MASVNDAWARLGKAVLCQAIRDATGTRGHYTPMGMVNEARNWLLTTGEAWSDLCGAGITFDDIQKLADHGWTVNLRQGFGGGRLPRRYM